MTGDPRADGSGQSERPRIAFLSFSSGEYDARTFRIARSAQAAGYQVTVYARWHAGQASTEMRDGYRLIRVPFDWRLAVPGLRGRARARWSLRLDREAASDPTVARVGPAARRRRRPARRGVRFVSQLGDLRDRVLQRIDRSTPLQQWHWWLRIREFPLRPMGWAAGLEEVSQAADIWHGMWAGSLPALVRLQARHGGRTIYDSRDVFMKSRTFARLGRPGRTILEWCERRYAAKVDRVLTVNAPYASLIQKFLHVSRPIVVMNCPEIWTPPTPPPDLIRAALGLSEDTRIVLYQGIFTIERGIEQAMEAILEVPGAVLALLGFGILTDELTDRASRPPYRGKVFILPAVTPERLLAWTASADVSVMAIQPTTLNHRYTTPQKLFESLAAGVPVVASDLPGMAEIVEETGAGLTCDPTDPHAIATAIDRILQASPTDRDALRSRAMTAARTRYNWEAQSQILLELYQELASS